MRLRQMLTALIVSAVAAACASAPAVIGAGSQPEADQTSTSYPIVKRWTGTLNPTQSYNAAAAGSQRQNAHGRVQLTVSPNAPTLTHVTLSVTVPVQPGSDIVGWALSPGNCKSGTPPVLSSSSFPAIQLSTDGHGNVDADIGFAIPDNGSYHVSVFRGSNTQLTDMITCAELRRES